MKQFIQYTYDLAGNRTRVIEPGGGRFTCAYDSLNRLSTLENPQSQRTTFSYDDNSRRTASRLSNGSRASFTYDAASNITRLANLKSDLTTLSSFDYRYDKVNNRQAMIEGDGARTTYSYDNSYQLLSEFRTGSSAYRNTYTYDNAANRTLKNESGTRTTTTYDAANQINYALASGGRTTYAYDADGNQQKALEPSGARTTTLWDYENKTRRIELPSGVRNTMAYEPDGLRVKLQESASEKRFIYDGQAYLLETNSSNVTTAIWTQEPTRYGKLISQRRGSTTSWAAFEANGSTRQLLDASQNVTDSYLYDAFGNVVASSGSTVNPFQWHGAVGYYRDADTGLYYVRARILNPRIAVWTSIDPLLFVDGTNLYRLYFVPNGQDPSGMGPHECVGESIAREHKRRTQEINRCDPVLKEQMSGIFGLLVKCAIRNGCLANTSLVYCDPTCGKDADGGLQFGSYVPTLGYLRSYIRICTLNPDLYEPGPLLDEAFYEEAYHALTICAKGAKPLNAAIAAMDSLAAALPKDEQNCANCLAREALAKRCAGLRVSKESAACKNPRFCFGNSRLSCGFFCSRSILDLGGESIAQAPIFKVFEKWHSDMAGQCSAIDSNCMGGNNYGEFVGSPKWGPIQY